MSSIYEPTLMGLQLLLNTAHTINRGQMREITRSLCDNERDKLLLTRVWDYLSAAHKGQQRKGDTLRKPNNPDLLLPYEHHLYAVWSLGVMGGENFAALLARLLHDSVEDGPKRLNKSRGEVLSDLRGLLPDVYREDTLQLVQAVTNQEGLSAADKNRVQLEKFIKMEPGAQRLKLDDKCANLYDDARNPPQGWSAEKRAAGRELAVAMLAAAKDPRPHHSVLIRHLAA